MVTFRVTDNFIRLTILNNIFEGANVAKKSKKTFLGFSL